MWSLLDFRLASTAPSLVVISETTDTEGLRHSCILVQLASWLLETSGSIMTLDLRFSTEAIVAPSLAPGNMGNV